MSGFENLFGQSPRSVAVLFSLILNRLLKKNNGLSTEDFCQAMANPDEVSLDFEASACVKHAETVMAVLNIQALAFLTDEQKAELNRLRAELAKDWKSIAAQASPAGTIVGSELQLNFEKIDSLLITQLEWMSDVGFENCSRGQRLEILSESPVFEVLEMD